ncbi:substrate-binding domain-containing protein [Streptomyces sp. ID05-04B]|uniref:sugar ABC transporter substrate-binding protein n=1 Tax=unclassified Streptomyces TaxID=2593676 RepID=UPI000D1B5E89|nr:MULTISPECIES: substrate-binding domain-containing protein [unclassified Streptomyces]AVV41473.1 ABC transporter substrate-binding protein [Streptomyces sp. P3]MDX5566492.1 substrate-binding domain-containing protein [Streptomyces sp. ID05-04B]
MRRIAIAVIASAMSLSLAGCGMLGASEETGDATPTRSNAITVGVLMPEETNTRYAEFDYPIIKKKVAALTANQGRTDYANAASDEKTQDRQMQKMIDDKVDIILLDAVDAKAIAPMVKKAKEAKIPVIAYDRLAEGPIDAYVSFDNELVGEVQGRSLVEAIPNANVSDKIVMVNGSPADPNAGQFKAGALSEISGRVTIAKSYDTDKWSPEVAQASMTKAIAAIGKSDIAGVYSANDAMAGGIIKALEAAGVKDTDLPPITGQDAELPAVQRIISGEQFMSVYKPYPAMAEAAAEAAVAKVQGRDLQFEALTRDTVDSPTDKAIPAKLVTVVALTKKNIQQTVIADGIYKASDICTAKYKSACEALNLI